jgi:hypothetical protein
VCVCVRTTSEAAAVHTQAVARRTAAVAERSSAVGHTATAVASCSTNSSFVSWPDFASCSSPRLAWEHTTGRSTVDAHEPAETVEALGPLARTDHRNSADSDSAESRRTDSNADS